MTAEEVRTLAKDNGLLVPPSGWMRERAVAKFLGIASRTLREHMQDGNCPKFFRHNGRTVFTVQAVADYINERERGAKALR
jgi:predicted site-specific integrase-resolvase